jgi:WD40 repeat protein
MANLFVSYARTDSAFAHRVHDALIAHGHDVWVDWEDIPPTAEWLNEIKTAIDRADAMLFLVSVTSGASKTCSLEIAHAVERHKRLIPIVAEAVSPDAVQSDVAKLQWIYCRATDDFDARMAEVLRAIDLDLDWVRAHTRLLTRAVEWQGRSRDSSLLLRGNDLRNAEEWLVQASNKEPKPVAAQQEFVAASRRAANVRQRTTVAVLATGLVITAGLAVFALIQRQTAISQRDEARRQRTIVLGRQLAAQSEVVRTRSANQLDRGVLLAVEASRRAAGPDIDRALRESVGILPTLLSEQQQRSPVQGVSISGDGALCAAGGDEGVVRIWQCASGQETWRHDFASPVSRVSFTPDGSALAISGAAGLILHHVSANRDLVLTKASTSELAVGGNLLAGGGKSGRITVWRIDDGAVAAEFDVGSEIAALNFSSDARLLASGASDNTVRVWDVESRREIMRGRHAQASASMPLRLGSRDGGVFAVAFDPRGRWVVSGGQDHAVRIHELQSGRELFRAYHSDSIYSVAASPDGRWLASGGMDETARVWDLADGSERYRLVHQYVVQKVLWNKGGNLVTVSGDGTARVWSISTGAELSRMFAPGYIHDAALSTDGLKAITGSWDGLARAWQLTGAAGARLQLSHSDATRGTYSPDGKWLATIGQDEFVKLWSLPAGTLAFRFKHEPFTSSAEFSPDSSKLVTTGWDGFVHRWDVASGKEIGTPIQHQGRVVDAQFSPDGRVVATAGFEDGTAVVFDAASGRELYRVRHPGVVPKLRMQAGVRNVAFSADGRLLATGGQDGIVLLTDVATGRELQRFAHDGYIVSVTFTPDAKYVIVDSDGFVTVWTRSDGTKTATISKKAEDDQFMAVRGVSPDGRLVLVSSSAHHAVQVRSLPELTVRASLLHDDDIFSAVFNRAGTLVLTASRDKTARLWDATTWQELVRVAANGFVYEASFSPDERSFVTASGDGLVRLWDVEGSAMATTACERLKRNLSQEEWRQYLGNEDYSATCKLSQ